MLPSPALAISVDNLSDWQLQIVTVDRLAASGGVGGHDFWLRKNTLGYLFSSDLSIRTEGLQLTHTPSGRRVFLTAQTFTFAAETQVKEGVRGEASRLGFRRRFLAVYPIKTLCIGQLLTSGEHAVDGIADLPPNEAARLLTAVGDTLLRCRPAYRAVLLKDISPPGSALTTALQQNKCNSLPAEPVMVMDLRPFATFDEYLERLSSKYRIRYRRARSKLGPVVSRVLPKGEINELLPTIFALYEETSRGADFNVVTLTPGYFSWLAAVGEYRGYFNADGLLIGFTTAIANGEVYQAHFLGLREAAKYDHHLYHNMLFDHLAAAIVGGFASLDYGRTAPEIKSSIGAEPVAYSNLLRLRSPWLNYLVPHFAPTVFTAKDWQARSPLRQ